MNPIIMFLILQGGFFIIGLFVAICEQQKHMEQSLTMKMMINSTTRQRL